MANSISVAVGESDTIALGLWARVTGPFAAATVTGKAAGVDCGAGVLRDDAAEPELEHAVTSATTAANAADNERAWWGTFIERTALPPRTGFAAQGRRPGSPHEGGSTVAGQRRILTGLRCAWAIPGEDPGRARL
jgi:hypothetical protein